MSNVSKEYESRIMLTESEYFMIVSHFMRLHPEKQFIKNINIYYDTKDYYLTKNHITLRIRIIDDNRRELTLKISHPDGDDEINDTLTKSDADSLINGGIFPNGEVKKRLLTLPYSLKDYHEITTLENTRLEIENNDHLLVIDKNIYSGIIDYNLEIEANDSIMIAMMWMKEYMKQFNIAMPTEKYVGKAHRAINEVLKKN